jgi:hypothetical protein
VRPSFETPSPSRASGISSNWGKVWKGGISEPD